MYTLSHHGSKAQKKARLHKETKVNFRRREIGILIGNITNWPGSSTVQDRKVLPRVVKKSSQNIISTNLPSISDIKSEMSALSPKDTRRQHPRPATVCSPCSHLAKHTEVFCRRTTRLQSISPQAAVERRINQPEQTSHQNPGEI